jgi:hypothetical protein
MLDQASDHNKCEVAEAIDRWIDAGRPDLDFDTDTEYLVDAIVSQYGSYQQVT